jgi:hypothetical protein
MNIKRALSGLALAACMTMAGPASADILHGQVYQVGNGDVYIRMPDSTVARVPLETAQFKVDGVVVPGVSLKMGQDVVADYTPVYGFQRFYNTSTDLDGVRTVYIIQDVDPHDVSTVEWDGRVYLIKK